MLKKLWMILREMYDFWIDAGMIILNIAYWNYSFDLKFIKSDKWDLKILIKYVSSVSVKGGKRHF